MSDVVIALIGALIGALLGILGTFFTLRFNYRELYAKTVSENRNVWRNELRGNISKMVAAVYKSQGSKNSNEYFEYRTQVLTRLSPKQPLHMMLQHLIHDLDKLYDEWCETEFKDLQNKIVEISCIIMKTEWETVKKEAKGSK